MFDELEKLWESDTIKPSFDYVHVVLALFIFGKHPEGIGRYKLKSDLIIGSGTARSLINRLSETIDFIKVHEENKRKGHILTQKGQKFLSKIKEKIVLLIEGDLAALKDLIINYENIYTFISMIKEASGNIKSGIEQRDAAIRVDGLGATCLIYDGENFQFPSKSSFIATDEKIEIKKEIQSYLSKIIENYPYIKLEEKDVIVIGLGDSFEKARLASVNAALSLI